ncbi:MAG: Mth938-like domain-containing protein [Alphaproteobacteria bacterium]
MEFTPLRAGERLTVEGYGAGTFKVAGGEVAGSMLIRAERFDPWPVDDVRAIGEPGTAPLKALAGEIDVLLVGTGATLVPLAPSVRSELRTAGLGVEIMNTPAACRTYNLLVAEGRRVAAAVVAMPPA